MDSPLGYSVLFVIFGLIFDLFFVKIFLLAEFLSAVNKKLNKTKIRIFISFFICKMRANFHLFSFSSASTSMSGTK